MFAHRLRPLPLVALALCVAAPALSQEVVQALPGTTDADALASDMRRLAANPRDIGSLVDAAHLSLRLGDLRAAAALLQRAENVNPRDPRVKAGQASVLLQSERPGQALRYFAEAEAQGLDPSSFAADRGLAYDLTGQQERAQRDYAVALRSAPNDDETIRRYALSLGISGQRQRALALLDPLVRRGDRAAWRSQAFVLAMTGDIGGAQRIAATMMPGGAAGLSAFFERLPTLPASDRAFAVQFGEVRSTPERLADARLAPPVASLTREAVVLASAQPLVQQPPLQSRGRRNARDRRTTDQAATVTPAPVVLAATVLPARPLAPAPRQIVQPAPLASSTIALVPITTAPVPATRPSETTGQPLARPVGPAISSSVLPVARESVTTVPVTPSSQPTVSGGAAAAIERSTPSLPPAPAPVQLAAASIRPSVPAASTAPIAAVEIPPSAPVPVLGERVAVPSPRTSVARAGEDSILARIIAGLSIPGSELGIAQPTRPTPAPIVVAATPTPAPAPVRAEPVPVPISVPRPDRAAVDRIAAAQALAEKRAADRKAVADRKALADRKAAAEKKAVADKEAAEKRKIERSNPGRIWVQVAGGANESDLPKAYAAVKAKAPAVFGSRGAYTTPLRATNRVLTGPFKSDAEARTFVNDLKKEGVSAFTFSSDAGQPVARLGARGKADESDAEDTVKPSGRARRRR